MKIIEARAPAEWASKAPPPESGSQIAQTTPAETRPGGAIRRPDAAVGPYGAFFDWLFNQR